MVRPRTTIELVRHAQALPRDGWQGAPDHERPLDRSGFVQARWIARTFAGSQVAALYSSPFLRCRQTLEPLGAATGLPVRDEDALGEERNVPVKDGDDGWVTAAWLGGRAVRFLDRAADAHRGARLVACSHGDVIPATVAVLAGRDSLPLADVHLDKGGWYTLEYEDGRCVQAIAHPPASEDP